MRVAAIIPARGGSTRIPRKNLAQLGGKSLLSYTVNAAFSATLVDEVYVSTDDQEIAAAARNLGAGVIWRPASLSTETAPTEPALIHAVKTLEANGRLLGAVVMLQPTSPLRPARRIDQAIELFVRTGCDTVASVHAEVGYYFLGELEADQRLRLGYDPQHRLRTQDIAPRYKENGAIYVIARDQLLKHRCRIGEDLRAIVLSKRESIDIDTLSDLRHCEALLGASDEVARKTGSTTPAKDHGKSQRATDFAHFADPRPIRA